MYSKIVCKIVGEINSYIGISTRMSLHHSLIISLLFMLPGLPQPKPGFSLTISTDTKQTGQCIIHELSKELDAPRAKTDSKNQFNFNSNLICHKNLPQRINGIKFCSGESIF